MSAPGTAYDDDVLGKDPQPAHMDDYVETTDDNGGVHLNSGIPNRAFFLVADALGGRAWERAGQVWYDTLVGGLAVADRRLRRVRRGHRLGGGQPGTEPTRRRRGPRPRAGRAWA